MSITIAIDQMTLEDKLRIMETLWDDLRRQEQSMPTPQWHKDVLDARERLLKKGKARFIDWETAKKRIARRVS